MAQVAFTNISKVYPGGPLALDDFSLDLQDGEFMVLVGPSGCGKTTALRMLAGLEDITSGTISIDDEPVNDVAPQDRDIAMVFQNYALYPHMTVYENIAFGLQTRKVAKAEVKQRVEEVGRTLGLSDLLSRKPRALSGGQRQRVAMGRAIVREPKVFLMDEPLSNLDAKLRVQMRAEISRLQRELGVTTLYVTHDQVEAMTMADRIAVLRRGVLQQLGTPQDLYETPTNLFVASFVGSPAMNLVRARVVEDAGSLACMLGQQKVPLPPSVVRLFPSLPSKVGSEIAFGVRPEHLSAARGSDVDGPQLRATLQLTEMLGFDQLAYLELDAPPVVTDETLDVARDIDVAVGADLVRGAEQATTTVVARFEGNHRYPPGEVVELAIAIEQVQLFDLATSETLREPTHTASLQQVSAAS